MAMPDVVCWQGQGAAEDQGNGVYFASSIIEGHPWNNRGSPQP